MNTAGKSSPTLTLVSLHRYEHAVDGVFFTVSVALKDQLNKPMSFNY